MDPLEDLRTAVQHIREQTEPSEIYDGPLAEALLRHMGYKPCECHAATIIDWRNKRCAICGMPLRSR